MAPLAFITGASSGIGQALAARCYRAGYRLALVGRRGAEMHAWVHARGFESARVAVHAADVRDVDAIAAIGRACLATHGVPDIVVANAGISVGIDTAQSGDLEVMRATLETNLLGMAATFHPFLAPMRARRSGRLVGVASMAGIRGLPGHGAYCASKAGVMAYCESLRGECRPYGVKVVTLVPGYVDTPLTRANRYRMPFLMDADRFADQAFDAIVAGASRRIIPWQMAVVARLLRALPDTAFDALLAGRPRKRRQGE